MLDSGDGREPWKGALHEDRDLHQGARSCQLRQFVAAAWIAARAILLIGIVPLYLAGWLAAVLAEIGASRPFAVVSVGLFGLALSFAGAILHLKLLARATSKRQH